MNILKEIQSFPVFEELAAHHPGYVWRLGAVRMQNISYLIYKVDHRVHLRVVAVAEVFSLFNYDNSP